MAEGTPCIEKNQVTFFKFIPRYPHTHAGLFPGRPGQFHIKELVNFCYKSRTVNATHRGTPKTVRCPKEPFDDTDKYSPFIWTVPFAKQLGACFLVFLNRFPIIVGNFTFLIILGGLGFTVIIDLHRYFFIRERVKKLALHSKIVLITSGTLLVLGLTAFYITEYNGTMEGFTIAKRLLASWFQSVTTRTAGFNTIDTGSLSPASILITLALMFIGASPGSTGGGIKTTTFAVLVLSITSLLKGKRDLSICNRKIPSTNIREATSLITLSATLIFFVLFLLLIVEPFPFDKIIFEAFSAFGTVGLSTGITPLLSQTGKFLITILMYVGRIGPLTMIYAFAIKRNVVNLDYAEEKIAIG